MECCLQSKNFKLIFMSKNKIIIVGGSGSIGTALANEIN